MQVPSEVLAWVAKDLKWFDCVVQTNNDRTELYRDLRNAFAHSLTRAGPR